MRPELPPSWLVDALKRSGDWLSWAEVMRRALYEPPHGYYTGEPRKLGRSGDFFTAVSVGPLYGSLLAQHLAILWEAWNRPVEMVLLEQAAHDGQLCHDVLTALKRNHPSLLPFLTVRLIESQSAYREAQSRKIRAVWEGPLDWVDDVTQLDERPSLLICNELLDALPVERVLWRNGQWWQQGVALDKKDGLLHWRAVVPESERLLEELRHLPSLSPENYQTEVHPAMVDWIAGLGASRFRGAVWIVDYGFEADDYYHPDRTDGTLRRFFRHRSDVQILENLGDADLTSHINLTRLKGAAQESGFEIALSHDQGRVLTELAAPWLRTLEGRVPDEATRVLLRQFQTLTHPGLMGRSFQVMQFEKRGSW